MPASVMFHGVKAIEAKDQGTIGVLCFDAPDGSYVSVFMPYDKAKAMADAFNAAPPASFATSA